MYFHEYSNNNPAYSNTRVYSSYSNNSFMILITNPREVQAEIQVQEKSKKAVPKRNKEKERQ